MNDDRDEDLVRDFFAAHRARTRDHEADDETWEAITLEARRSRGRSRAGWFLGGTAAAAAAAVTTVLVLQGGLGSTPAPPAGAPESTAPTTPTATTSPATATPTGEAPTSSEATPTDGGAAESPTDAGPTEVTSPATPLPPADLSAGVTLVHEPTGDESDLRTAVYETGCAEAEQEWACPGLAVSEDAGRTWQARVDMFAAGYHGAVSARESTWMWTPQLRQEVPQARSALVRSDDGGRTWTDIPTRGDGVVMVETFRNTLVVVTRGCESGADCLEVLVTDVTTDDATSGRRLATLEDLPPRWTGIVTSTLPPGRLMATYDAIYIALDAGADRGQGPEQAVYRLADGEETATLVDRQGCTITAAPESQDSLVAICDDRRTVEVSADGGATWAPVQGPEADQTQVLAAASNDGSTIALATEATLWVGSADGWTRAMDRAPVRTRLDALGGTSLRFGGDYRFAPDAEPALSQRWTSDDDGVTWTEQPPIEIPTQ